MAGAKLVMNARQRARDLGPLQRALEQELQRREFHLLGEHRDLTPLDQMMQPAPHIILAGHRQVDIADEAVEGVNAA